MPGLWSVLVTNAFDQGFRFSVDKASYELLYLPIPPAPARAAQEHDRHHRQPRRGRLRGVAPRAGDAGVCVRFPASGWDCAARPRSTWSSSSVWIGVAWRLRREYVRTIHESIHRHRLDTERAASTTIEKSAAEALRAKLAGGDASEVRYALGLLEVQQTRSWQPGAPCPAVSIPRADIRRRALSLLRAAGDREIAGTAVELLKDPDLGVRTEALLYLTREMHVDPLSQIQKLGDFEDFSIRAGMAAFLASPGPAQNLDRGAGAASRAWCACPVRMACARARGGGAPDRARAGRVPRSARRADSRRGR